MFKGTTILSVRRNGKVVVGGDGQVTLGDTIVKSDAKKIRKLDEFNVVTGFAGATADAFTLFEKLQGFLKNYPDNLLKASVELAKLWRTDRMLRRLEAMMIAVNSSSSLLISGTGDVLNREDDILAIGSGGSYAHAAAMALYKNTDLSARDIVEKALIIASEICIYTNSNLTIEELDG
ncbi:ATP-dependent protease subunit HslV [Candidatus Calescamantes bacterium]|nr:ATP-dependent protease subunit HslV [Candidatus Calescamantes bacterium]MCK5399531.1 ATP-dependent protease subunit HslV [bacterium]MCK5600112.1 ATP-dependent protease subunit HslV [bacterium]